MLNLIETALLAGQKIKAGEARLADYPEYVDLVRQQEEIALRLLDARYQMMTLAVLTQLIPIARNNWEGFYYKIWGARWKLDLAQLNSSQLRQATFRLKEAAHARDLLRQLGLEPRLNDSIAGIYANAEVENAPVARESGEVLGENERARLDFLEALQAVTQ